MTHSYHATLLNGAPSDLYKLEDMRRYVDHAEHPNADRLAAAIVTTVATSSPEAIGLKVREALDGAICPQTLALVLPCAFQDVVSDLAAQWPFPTVQTALDFNACTPCLQYSCNLPSEDGREVNVLVPLYRGLATMLAPMGRRSLGEQWVPVLAVAGDMAAQGGFHLNARLVAKIQRVRLTSRLESHPSRWRHPSRDSRDVIERYGYSPWKFGRFRDTDIANPDLLMATPWDEAPDWGDGFSMS
jgi:hypothetical protein